MNLSDKYRHLFFQGNQLNISDKYKCIFIHIPRTAGTSIKEALEIPGTGHRPWQFYYDFHRACWNAYIKFTVVRNPWDRAVSAYNYTIMKKSYWHDNQNRIHPHPDYDLLSGKSFTEYCEILLKRNYLLVHKAWYPQYFWIVKLGKNSNSYQVNVILRYENLENDFADLCKRLKVGNIRLPYVNKSDRKHYREYYTQETKQIIENLYINDIRLFNYEF
jgi:hypothetical protein